MKPLDIYFQYPIELIQGKGCVVTDSNNNEYVDFYGGHGVISIGHSHPNFVNAVTDQINKLAFYSNAFKNSLQNKLAALLGEVSGYSGYHLFLSNSGAEANENALKVASFSTQRQKVLAVKGAFHGRSAGAVAITDNKTIQPNFGNKIEVDFIDINNISELKIRLSSKDYAAFIIEGIQGVNGIYEPTTEFWEAARFLCIQTGTVLIVDEVQSGYGRTGKFFAHQHHNIIADIVTVGKGMGNGFPMAGTIINEKFKLKKGKLGTTFGGGQLACAAGISVLNVLKDEDLLLNAEKNGDFIRGELEKNRGVKSVRGRGLMLGIEFFVNAKEVRQKLMDEFGIITGFSSPDILRILPPLNLTMEDAEYFVNSICELIDKLLVSDNTHLSNKQSLTC